MSRTARGMGPAGGGGFPLGGGFKLGGGALILIVLASLIFGINPLEILGLLGGGAPPTQQALLPPGYGPQRAGDRPARRRHSARKVLGDTEDVWGAVFKAMGSRYDPPSLVLYDRRVESACGVTPSAAGPFYCPGDQHAQSRHVVLRRAAAASSARPAISRRRM